MATSSSISNLNTSDDIVLLRVVKPTGPPKLIQSKLKFKPLNSMSPEELEEQKRAKEREAKRNADEDKLEKERREARATAIASTKRGPLHHVQRWPEFLQARQGGRRGGRKSKLQ